MGRPHLLRGSIPGDSQHFLAAGDACSNQPLSVLAHQRHASSQGSGAGWCKSCHATGTNYLGNMERKSLTHQSRGNTPLDCSQSGCHRPLGNKGAAYTKWD